MPRTRWFQLWYVRTRSYFQLLRTLRKRESQYALLRKIGVNSVTVPVRGHKMRLNLRDEVLGKHFFIYREYESFETDLLTSLIKPGMTILDIGANIGYYTLQCASQVGIGGHVISFEPDRDNLYFLKHNVRLNHYPQVVCEENAVSDKDGQMTLYLSLNNHGDHRIFDSNDDQQFNNGIVRKTVSVSSVRIDTYLTPTHWQADLIKIDVQGAEMFVVTGMEKTLQYPSVVLFTEFWPHGLRTAGISPNRYLLYLLESGLSLFEIDEVKRRLFMVNIDELSDRFPDLGHANLVGLRPQYHSSFLNEYANYAGAD